MHYTKKGNGQVCRPSVKCYRSSACRMLYKNNNTVSIHVDCNKAKLARSNQAKATLAIGDRSCEESQGAHSPQGAETHILREHIHKVCKG